MGNYWSLKPEHPVDSVLKSVVRLEEVWVSAFRVWMAAQLVGAGLGLQMSQQNRLAGNHPGQVFLLLQNWYPVDSTEV